MIPGLRPIDALVAWFLNAAAPLIGGLLWLLATLDIPSTGVNIALRLIGTGLLAGWLVLRRGLDVTAILGAFRSPKRAMLIGFAAGLAFFVAQSLLVVVWNYASRVPNLGDGSWNPWVTTEPLAGPYLVFFVGLAIMAPLVEEFVHRGVAWSALRTRLGRAPAMLATSVVFALGHPFGPYGTRILAAFLSGVLFVWLADRYDSLGPAWAAHVTMNLMVFIVGWSAFNVFGLPGLILD